MALNAAMAARRTTFLGGTDMRRILKGNAEDIHRLWREKLGEEVPEDLDNVWAVQLGLTTEKLNRGWYELKQHHTVTRVGERVFHPFVSWAAVTLDGWIEELNCPLECKHVGGRQPITTVIETYQPQMQWQCECTGAEQVALSIIIGADEPRVFFVERDVEYCAILIERGRQFWRHVQDRTPPVDLPEISPPIIADKIYEMEGNNIWASHAATWLDSRASAAANASAAKELKALVPADANKASGHGVLIVRDKRGLSLRAWEEID